VAAKTEKVMYNLPRDLVQRIRNEAKRRSKSLGFDYGVQTGVVKRALLIGIKALEKEKTL
jgi:hypothetical protein